MGDISEQKIVIDQFTGQPDGENLLGCYFMLKSGVDIYDFYDKDDRLKGRNIGLDSDFTFTLDYAPDITWHLTLNSVAGEILSGTWRGEHDPAMADGTYQAQAGGSGEEEPNTSSACA